ncbi:hypothetical protein LCGC14_1364960 [marine sediment metagenome]|uniref:Uncharacterized protein n=1 Tax=marine sediment metagenome TaxID=412755 RepID=A0A0F9MM63_9ZZZZ
MAEKKEVIPKVETKVEIPKELVETPKKVGPVMGGTLKRTLKELESLDVQLKDLFSVKNMTINLSWIKLIRLINFNADKVVLKWNHTFEETLEIIELFLF